MKRYNLVNNLLGWLCFAVAAVTYLLTVEPTASFWDCPEFIAQGYKLEVGHPPGNPIFMLTARFVINFVGGDPSNVAIAVNSMSALLSAGTILLLFWTITHFVRRLVTADDATEYSVGEMVAIFGSGLVGALAYTWSDTFWFSAVEGEVYAFSSFCTALVVWLILKWENRADSPHSDRYLLLIAYVIGISIAVHLLNLLCIPAIVLVFYYKKFRNVSAKGSLVALGISAVIVGLILYGLVPGFIEVAQYFELLTVNTFGWSYNSGVLLYSIITVGVFIWALTELYRQRSAALIRLSFGLSILVSGIPFIGSSLWIPIFIIAALAIWLSAVPKLPVRIMTLTVLSVFVIFIGYSSYALLLIRSSANTPMNQNAPDNVFDLASYLNREQYGERPLFFGQTFTSEVLRDASGAPLYDTGDALYAKAVKTSPDDPDHYDIVGHKQTYKYIPELNMLFPRIYDSSKAGEYMDWIGITENDLEVVRATTYMNQDGTPVPGSQELMRRPTFRHNWRYFINYQLGHMYLRYFMWNFAGRQNDLAGNGEVNRGNWISGIPVIDTPRLGDQSYLPDDFGKNNPGHNVYYMLPLLLGIVGLLWQAFYSQRGIEQFWVVFFLFFMTGIAIVLYLNQTPGQPRERDYAFAGSFYAFCIWIGMGVAALWTFAKALMSKGAKGPGARQSAVAAVAAAAIGLVVPLQMVSQTWDDHNRAGRYTTRDFGMNYLSSLDPDAIIFTNGDNDTFPLWYAQEVEGFRTDVRVVNLSYLTTAWYANQQRIPSYDGAPVPMLATPNDYGQDRRQYSIAVSVPDDTVAVPMLNALRLLYDNESDALGKQLGMDVPVLPISQVYIPVDLTAAVEAGRIDSTEVPAAESSIDITLISPTSASKYRGLNLSQVLSLDILASSVADGWKRPVYFAMTVPNSYYMGLDKYMRATGLAYEVTPIIENGQTTGINTAKMYDNVVNKFRWGGLDKMDPDNPPYLDETVRRMVITNRSAMFDLAVALISEQQNEKALQVMRLMDEKLPAAIVPYGVQMGQQIADSYAYLAGVLADDDALDTAERILEQELRNYAQYLIYFQHLAPWQYQRLSRNDRYVRGLFYGDGEYDSYFRQLVTSYVDVVGTEKAEALLKELQAGGVDFSQLPSSGDVAD